MLYCNLSSCPTPDRSANTIRPRSEESDGTIHLLLGPLASHTRTPPGTGIIASSPPPAPAPAPGRAPSLDNDPHIVAHHDLHAPGRRLARRLGHFDHHRDKPCIGVRRRAMSTLPLEQQAGVKPVAPRHRRGRLPAAIALRDDAPPLRVAPSPPGQLRIARPGLLLRLRHLRSCSLDWRAPPRCPIPIAHVRSITTIREGGTHRMHTNHGSCPGTVKARRVSLPWSGNLPPLSRKELESRHHALPCVQSLGHRDLTNHESTS